ncbi:ABC transporter ATP-binding protein [candidate division KSB1 bacterium]|nr:ABC transporter ATP-binding protein [candidate division KSB1 bacterium]
MIQVSQLSKSYESIPALKSLSLDVPRGCLYGLVGPNGAGKSTLFKLMMGIIEPDEGIIQLDDKSIHFGDVSYKRSLGYAPELPLLYDYLTGDEFIRFVAASKVIGTDDSIEQMNHWTTFFGMESKMPELVKSYSQGMRRKLSLMAAVIGHPRILLLDEATNGLDPESSYKFKQFLRDFCNQGGTVLFSSHIIETVELLCDRLYIIHNGTLRKQIDRTEWETYRQQGSSLEQVFIKLVGTEAGER